MGKSAKQNAFYAASILKAHGCTDIVMAPGSRNAPLLIELANDSDYKVISVPDERSAAFTAMGIALGNDRPAAVICSSGSAVVNFYPAVVEAFYQKLPLIVISADRPTELVGQGAGQTIDQVDVFRNHIVHSVSLIREPADDLARSYNQRVLNEAMLASAQGPVHINIPFDEPLYELSEEERPVKIIRRPQISYKFDDELARQLVDVWNSAPKVMVLAGQMKEDAALIDIMRRLNEKSPFLTLSETVSNLASDGNIASIDRLINTISSDQKAGLYPDLLITIGGEVVSKMIKAYLRSNGDFLHWHIDPQGHVKDTFFKLDAVFKMDPLDFFSSIMPMVNEKDQAYRDLWLSLDNEKSERHREYLEAAPYSDFKVYGQIFKALPARSILHSANSTSIRYSQLFDHPDERSHFANRGTSGIDGCTSTAVGHAMTTERPVTLITGDIAYVYDSNGLWNSEFPGNLRIIVINNGGGNIFRIIDGPVHDESFETYQETSHELDLKGIAATFGLDYTTVDNEQDLKAFLPEFYKTNDGPRVLEVKTPRLTSPQVLKEYFNFLSND